MAWAQDFAHQRGLTLRTYIDRVSAANIQARHDPDIIKKMRRAAWAENLKIKVIQPDIDLMAKFGQLPRAVSIDEMLHPRE